MTSYKHKMRLAALSAALGASVLAGCSTYNSLTGRIVQRITPYRVTIVQGNFVSSEAAAQLKVGMSRDQVRSTLGTPLLTDMFHPERWDYIFYFKRGSTAVVQQRDLIINFNGDLVSSWSGADDLPSNQDLINMIDGDRRETNLLKEKHSAKTDAAQARAEDAAAKAGVPASAVAGASGAAAAAAASGAVPANQRVSDSANNAMTTPPDTSNTSRTRNVPQSAILHAVPQSAAPAGAQSPGEFQFHFSPPSHLRPAGGDSLLARPPGDDAASGTSATGK